MNFKIGDLVRVKAPVVSSTDVGVVEQPTLRIVYISAGRGRGTIDAALCEFVDDTSKPPVWFALNGIEPA